MLRLIANMGDERQALDRCPGATPDIRTVPGSVVYIMIPAGLLNREQLVIRCDEHGGVWIAIEGNRGYSHDDR
jgi:hypothetical protein